MDTFVAIQHTYDGIEIALFRDKTVLAQQSISKFHASAVILTTLDRMLAAQDLRLADLAFFAANYGPGPFTTLRVVIASLNGIAFASNIPLIGVDGLRALMEEYRNTAYDRTICLLNAFNHDVYYAYYNEQNELKTGSANGEQFLRDIAPSLSSARTIQFLGNAVAPHQALISELFNDRALITEPIPATCSVHQIGLMSYAQWQRSEGMTHQLLPHYLKTQQFAKAS